MTHSCSRTRGLTGRGWNRPAGPILQIGLLLVVVLAGASCGGSGDGSPAEGSDAWQVDSGYAGAVVDEEALQRLLERAQEERTSALLLAVDGHVVARQGTDEPIEAMSVTKSFVSLAVGFLIDDDVLELEDPAVRWFPEWRGTAHEGITVRHLLSHTSGLASARTSLDGGDIAAHGVASSLTFPPGSRFAYSNNAVDVLGVLVHRAGRQPVDELLRERLWEPLGIDRVTWLRDTRGEVFAAGELTLPPSALLRVGQMLVDGGMWNGHRIVSQDWIALSTSPSQPHVPSAGLLWRIHGDFRLAVTGRILEGWAAAGMPEAIRGPVTGLAGEPFEAYPQLEAALREKLGSDGFEAWRVWIGGHREVPYAEQVQFGDSSGFYAEGWLGQYLVVLPETRTVAVRMRRFAEEDADRSREKFAYTGFTEDVAALASLVPGP